MNGFPRAFAWCFSALTFALFARSAQVDTTFDAGVGPNPAGVVLAIQPLPDGRILVGGQFTTWNGAPRPGLVRLNNDGSLDSSFTFGLNASVSRIFLQGDTIWVQAASALVRLLADGSVDATVPPFVMNGLAVPSGENIFRVALPALPQPVVELWTQSGVFVTQLFAGSVGDEANIMEPLPNGGILLGGRFARLDTTDQIVVGTQGLEAITTQGLDPNFVSDAPPGVRLIALGPDGTIFVAADNPAPSSTLLLERLSASGQTDASFVAQPAAVLALAVEPDGRLVRAGHTVVRLNLDGSVDTNFAPAFVNATIETLAVQPDGRILAGGVFTSVDGLPRRNIARLLSEAPIPPSPPPPGAGRPPIIPPVVTNRPPAFPPGFTNSPPPMIPPPVATNIPPPSTNIPPVAQTRFTVSGQVTDGTSGVPGVRIRMGRRVAFTDVNGMYQFDDVLAGRYALHATLRHARIRPVIRRVTVREDVSGIDFRVIRRVRGR